MRAVILTLSALSLAAGPAAADSPEKAKARAAAALALAASCDCKGDPRCGAEVAAVLKKVDRDMAEEATRPAVAPAPREKVSESCGCKSCKCAANVCPDCPPAAAAGPGDRVQIYVGASTSITDPRVTDLSGGPRVAFALVKDGAGPSGKDYYLNRSAYPGKTWLNGVPAGSVEEILTWVQPRWAAGEVFAVEKDGGWAFTSTATAPKASPAAAAQLWSVPGRQPMTEAQLRALYPTMRFPHDPEPICVGGSCSSGRCYAPGAR